MKYLILISILMIVHSLIAQSHNSLEIKQGSSEFKTIYPFALRGEMGKVFEILKGLDNTTLSAKQIRKKEQYYNRFITKNEDFDFKTEDKEIIKLYKKFHHYWNSVLLGELEQEKADNNFKNEMFTFLKDNFKPKLSLKKIEKNYYQLFEDYFRSKGLYGLGLGKTGHMYDLYLWKTQREKTYNILLPEGSVEVPVVFMKDFISNGWSHYTTFGRSFSGGWAKKDKLFCVEETYDLKSEKFKVSYISHEGQHFSDYKTYPKLKQADLEYRAKLTELALAKSTVYHLINVFISHAKNDKKYAHAFANYQVIKSFSIEIFGVDFENDLNKWKSVSVEKINKTAVKILKFHSVKLNKLGAQKVVFSFM